MGRRCCRHAVLGAVHGVDHRPWGDIEPGGTYTDCLGDTLDIIGGQLSMNSECEIAGIIETSDGTIYVERGSIGEGRLFFAKTEQ